MAVASYAGSTVAAFLVVGVFMALMGFPVLDAYLTIFTMSFRSLSSLLGTLNHFVPLLLLSLAFAFPLLAWRFNIGGDGQMLVGATAAAAIGILFSDAPFLVLLPLGMFAGVLAGAVWAGIAAVLSDRFRISEVLTTVLLNFVAYHLVAYVAGRLWPNPIGGHALSTVEVGAGLQLPTLGARPLHGGLVLALGVAIACIAYVALTPGGFEFRATGANPRAAAVFGIKVRRVTVAALLVGGACAGLAGAIEVAGVYGRLVEGIHGDYMMLGIVIGLLSKGNLIAVPLIAFAVSVLQVGASATQRTIGLPAEMVLIVVGLVLLFVLLADLIRLRIQTLRWT